MRMFRLPLRGALLLKCDEAISAMEFVEFVGSIELIGLEADYCLVSIIALSLSLSWGMSFSIVSHTASRSTPK